jgi:hypothetical protein
MVRPDLCGIPLEMKGVFPSLLYDHPDGMKQTGDVSQQGKHDIYPEVKAKPHFKEYPDRGDNQ